MTLPWERVATCKVLHSATFCSIDKEEVREALDMVEEDYKEGEVPGGYVLQTLKYNWI